VPVELAVVIPVKAFGSAKKRLRGALPDADRARLARWMAERVVAAAQPLPTFVACDDDEVACWAEEHGAEVLWGPGLGLNGAVDHAVATVAGKGADHVLISHGDLPLPSSLPDVPRRDHVVLVPDRRRDGTNVLARPCSLELPAAYGAGSFRRHLGSALASGAPVSIRIDARLSLDIDTVGDCRHPLVVPVLRPVLGTAMPR
jgi:2-phospho-L-lactate guanylyltransferase